MKSKISFANEKDLIYGYKWEGSYMPEYGFCKVYKNGVVDYGEGWLIDVNKYIKGRMSIPEEAVHEIQKIIHDNSKILSIKTLESDGQYIITDGSTSTLYFSNGEKKNTLSIYALQHWEDSGFLPNYPKLELVLRLYKSIREILIEFGLGEEYC